FAGESAESIEEDIAMLLGRLGRPGIAPADRVALERQIARLELALAMYQAAAAEDWERYEELRAEADSEDAVDPERNDSVELAPSEEAEGKGAVMWSRVVKKLQEDPELVFYK